MTHDRREGRVVYRDDALVIGVWEDLFVQRWVGPGGVASVERMLAEHQRFVRARPARSTVSISHVDGASMRPPDEPSRAVMKEHAHLLSEHVRAVATVIESSGFGSAMIRSVVSGLVLLSRGGLAHQVFGQLTEGLDFVARHRDPAAAPIEVPALEALYRRSFGA